MFKKYWFFPATILISVLIMSHDYWFDSRPFNLQPGDTLKAAVFKKGHPASGMKVMAQNKTDKFIEKIAVSSSTGKVGFILDKHR
ncbi:MAG: hypothetical protein GXO83_09150 [Chlorobi bacterium]|nr:hypothetical protein [Chlorobiota bacterium]